MPTTPLDIERLAPMPQFCESTLDDVLAHAQVRTGFTTRHDWLRDAHKYLGGSDAAAVCGLDPYKSPLAVWSVKTGGMLDDTPQNEAMMFGTLFEPVLLNVLAQRTGRRVAHWPQSVRVIDRIDDWRACTPDGLQEDDTMPGVGTVQIKCSTDADAWADGVPLRTMLQVHHEMSVCDARWCTVGVLLNGNCFRSFDVLRDDQMAQDLVEAERHFWRMVQNRIPPEVDGSESTRDTVRRMWPTTTEGKVVTLPGEAIEVAHTLEATKLQIKALVDQCEAAESQLRAWLQDAEVGLLPDGSARYTLRQTTVPEHWRSETTHRRLRRVNDGRARR